MGTIGDRVKEIRNDFNLTQDKFGEKIGVKKSALSLIEKNERALTDSVLKNLLKEFCVNELWLKEEQGDKYNEKLKKEKEFINDDFLFMSKLLLSRQQVFFKKLKYYTEDEQLEMISVLEEIYSIFDVQDLEVNQYFEFYESSAGMLMEISKYVQALNSPEQFSEIMLKKSIEVIKDDLIKITELFKPDFKIEHEESDNTQTNVSEYQQQYQKKLNTIEVDEDELEFINIYRNLSLNDKEEVKMFSKFRASQSPNIKKKAMSSGLVHGEETATKMNA